MIELKHAKAFNYELGHVHFKAVTVGDLREFLAQFPADMPVTTTWEGTIHSLSCPEVIEYDGVEVLQFDTEIDVTKDA